MKNNKIIWGSLLPVFAALFAVMFVIAMISGEWVMFASENRNSMILTLAAPMLIQVFFYIVWYTTQSGSSSRNSDKLAKKGLFASILSITVSIFIMFALSVIYGLLDEGALFLGIASVLYVVSGIMQYAGFRPY